MPRAPESLRAAVLAALQAGGQRTKQIAATCGCSATYVRKVAAEEGLDLRTGRPRGRADETLTRVEQAISYRAQGMEIDEIAALLDRSRRAVLGYLAEMDSDGE